VLLLLGLLHATPLLLLLLGVQRLLGVLVGATTCC
jgi:hypothetical protein